MKSECHIGYVHAWSRSIKRLQRLLDVSDDDRGRSDDANGSPCLVVLQENVGAKIAHGDRDEQLNHVRRVHQTVPVDIERDSASARRGRA